MLEKEAREILSAFALVPGAEIDNRRIKAIHVLLTQVETKSDFIDNLYKTEKKSVVRIEELTQQLQARTDEVNTLTRRLAELNEVVRDRNEYIEKQKPQDEVLFEKDDEIAKLHSHIRDMRQKLEKTKRELELARCPEIDLYTPQELHLKKIEEMQQEISSRQHTIDMQRQEIRHKDRIIADWAKTAKMKDDAVAQANIQATEHAFAAEANKNYLEKVKLNVARMQDEIRDKDIEITKLTHELSRVQQKVDLWEKQDCGKTATIHVFNRRVAEVMERHEQRITKLEQAIEPHIEVFTPKSVAVCSSLNTKDGTSIGKDSSEHEGK